MAPLNEASAGKDWMKEKLAALGVQGKVPVEAAKVMDMLASMDVHKFDNAVVHMALDTMQWYIRSILIESRDLCDRAHNSSATSHGEGGPSRISMKDVKLATELFVKHQFRLPPQRDMLSEMARRVNDTRLPDYTKRYGIQLPPEKYCLTAVNYQLDPLGDDERIKDTAGLLARSGH